nr:hypothetical protein [uncultured bacterium]
MGRAHSQLAICSHGLLGSRPKGQRALVPRNGVRPTRPEMDGKLGYPVLCIESCGMIFQFTSREQLDTCIKTLSTRPLPSSRRLAAIRGGAGPNAHWLSRLPANVKSPKGRQQAIEDLSAVALELAPNNSFKPRPLRGSA